MSDDEQHVSRHEIALLLATMEEKLKSLESRLRYTIIITVLGANAIVALASPVAAAGLAAIGIGGIAAVKVVKIAALFMR